jgi:hypothetical protein
MRGLRRVQGIEDIITTLDVLWPSSPHRHIPPSLPTTSLTSPTTVTLALSDDDFGKLVAGKANAQRLFMSGKLKVKGDVMKATKMEPILKKAQGAKAKL